MNHLESLTFPELRAALKASPPTLSKTRDNAWQHLSAFVTRPAMYIGHSDAELVLSTLRGALSTASQILREPLREGFEAALEARGLRAPPGPVERMRGFCGAAGNRDGESALLSELLFALRRSGLGPPLEDRPSMRREVEALARSPSPTLAELEACLGPPLSPARERLAPHSHLFWSGPAAAPEVTLAATSPALRRRDAPTQPQRLRWLTRPATSLRRSDIVWLEEREL